MSTETPSTNPSESKSIHPAIASRTFRQLLTTVALVTAASIVLYVGLTSAMSRRDEEQDRKRAAAFEEFEKSSETSQQQAEALQSGQAAEIADLKTEMADIQRQWNDAEEQLRSLQIEASSQTSEQALAESELNRVRSTAQRAMRDLQSLAQQVSDWHSTSQLLLTNEAGRRIATDDGHVTLVADALARSHPDRNQVHAWIEELKPLARVFETGDRIAGSYVRVSSEHRARIAELATLTTAAMSALENDQQLIDRIVNATRDVDPGPHTLEAKVQQRSSADDERVLNLLESARQEALQEQAEKLAAVEREFITEQTDVIVARIEQATRFAQKRKELTQTRADIEEGLLEEQRKHLELVAEFERELPATRKYLLAFIEDGYTYRRGNPVSRGPVSLSLLHSHRALDPTKPGMESMMFIASRQNDRSRGAIPGFSVYSWQNLPKEPILKAQQFLKKYGDLMVNIGMLAE